MELHAIVFTWPSLIPVLPNVPDELKEIPLTEIKDTITFVLGFLYCKIEFVVYLSKLYIKLLNNVTFSKFADTVLLNVLIRADCGTVVPIGVLSIVPPEIIKLLPAIAFEPAVIGPSNIYPLI